MVRGDDEFVYCASDGMHEWENFAKKKKLFRNASLTSTNLTKTSLNSWSTRCMQYLHDNTLSNREIQKHT